MGGADSAVNARKACSVVSKQVATPAAFQRIYAALALCALPKRGLFVCAPIGHLILTLAVVDAADDVTGVIPGYSVFCIGAAIVSSALDLSIPYYVIVNNRHRIVLSVITCSILLALLLDVGIRHK